MSEDNRIWIRACELGAEITEENMHDDKLYCSLVTNRSGFEIDQIIAYGGKLYYIIYLAIAEHYKDLGAKTVHTNDFLAYKVLIPAGIGEPEKLTT